GGCQADGGQIIESSISTLTTLKPGRLRLISCPVESTGCAAGRQRRWTGRPALRTLLHAGTRSMSGFVSMEHLRVDSLRPHIAKAAEVIKDYTAIFVFPDGNFGSGTFVNIGGFAGILTAHHVAAHLDRFADFSLVVAGYPHRLEATAKTVQHISIG